MMTQRLLGSANLWMIGAYSYNVPSARFIAFEQAIVIKSGGLVNSYADLKC